MIFNPFVKFDCPICNGPLQAYWSNRFTVSYSCHIVTEGLFHYTSEWSYSTDAEGEPFGEAHPTFARFSLENKYKLYYFSKNPRTMIVSLTAETVLFNLSNYFPINLSNINKTVERIDNLIVFS